MAKVHTRVKRKATNKDKDRNRSKRPKTFKTKESAKKYAEGKGIKKYNLVNISTKDNKQKIKVVSQ
ncbi:MAG: hypothetical protein KJ583_03730 [Nanoarchaeota archaeon]|nr:hypothetical protein [Nanoarchaeota archaeon]MBU1269981.1 hypothetical protein [Nanoarchaeota archaeon]MBU1604403.1 hypothetical protein [Nanoarchaeota archaeon]MBU2442579.1 hypothetical protein [Nanoarchaeota archaeon]